MRSAKKRDKIFEILSPLRNQILLKNSQISGCMTGHIVMIEVTSTGRMEHVSQFFRMRGASTCAILPSECDCALRQRH